MRRLWRRKEVKNEIWRTANKVGILYIYTDYDKYKKSNGEAVESSLDVKAFATLEEAETGLFMIKARKYYRNSIKVDDITYSQMKAIFDILGIDMEEVIKWLNTGDFLLNFTAFDGDIIGAISQFACR